MDTVPLTVFPKGSDLISAISGDSSGSSYQFSGNSEDRGTCWTTPGVCNIHIVGTSALQRAKVLQQDHGEKSKGWRGDMYIQRDLKGTASLKNGGDYLFMSGKVNLADKIIKKCTEVISVKVETFGGRMGWAGWGTRKHFWGSLIVFIFWPGWCL